MKKKYLLLIFGLLSAASLLAQQRVTGKVTSSGDGDSLPGVSILQKGTSSGTVSDVDGNYSIEVPEGATLIYNFVGFKPQEVAVNGRSTIDVQLELDVTELDEVVVMGYGTTTKKDLTTSIAKVDPGQVSKAANANINDLLVGRAAGLKVTQQSAQPGGNIDLTIRGRVENPLIVVDGVQVPYSGLEPGVNFSEIDNVNRGGLAGLNPSDIESIEILKDGAASMYGIGAAGGVILITTKKGKTGERMTVNYSGNHSVQKNYDYIEPLGPREYMEHYNRYTQDLYLADPDNDMQPFGPNAPSNVPTPFTEADISAAEAAGATDWLGYMLRDGSIDNHNVSISGGTEKATYYFSGNYFRQVGTVQNSEMEKFNGRADLSFQLADWLKLSTNFIANRNNFVNTIAGWQTGGAGANGFTALQSALSYPTYLPVRDPNTGEYTQFQLRGNPLSLLDIDDETKYNSLYANFALDFTIIPEKLTAKVLYGNNFESSFRDFFIPSTTNWFDANQARASLASSTRQQQTLEAYATYTDDFADFLNVNIVGGVGQYMYDSFGYGLQATDMLDAINTTRVQAGQGTPLVNSSKNSNLKRSLFVRGTFSLWDRYILSGSYRYDGFNQFFPDNKFNAFPSASLAWKISNESFMQGLSFLDLLKVRGSVGTLGNANFNAYGAYAPDGDHVSFNGGSSNYVPYLLTRLDNPNLNWQKTVNKTVGLDFGLFDRVSGSLDLYQENVTRMLVEVNTPALSFLSTQFVNGREQLRKGIEFNIDADIVKNRDFNWNASANLSHFTHTWEKRHEEDDLFPWQGEKDPVNVIYAFETDGILQLGETAPAWQPANATTAGSPIFVDQNGDGTLDSADVKKYNILPKLSFGFGSNFRYKNFDLSLFFYGQVGANRTNFSLGWSDPRNMLNSESAGTSDMDLIWSSENPDGTLPGITYNESALGAIGNVSGVGTDVRISQANFLRARNITLGYTFTAPAVTRVVRDLRVYVDFQNPFVITKFKGVDPEVQQGNVKGAPAPYPMIRTYSIGVNANF
ncbi:SusC/RagA family TonB-linked outer membrane protein [Reichenbachiella ulvae]|uniref:SusC/RagA family TonB-linked outer membrane protein n=1 Tax=Reichenbachiella ulvae TaxID=2980104 RepID=A0ABT3CU25_9BACT|nr:SusC/RagA family TonB-linked outer membrane protein [Reichenbachiella ulvae]MCV9387024.1 SusC/RagA family TonB-linked outer membrane protein [Reichenbachiella ulvae]